MQTVKALAAEQGLMIDSNQRGGTSRKTSVEAHTQPVQPISLSVEQREAQQVNFSGYYRESMERLRKSEAAQAYLTGRGISLETAIAHNVGFDPAADPAGAPAAAADAYKAHPVPRIIIPTAPAHYVGRSIDPNTPGSYAKMNNKGGGIEYTADVVWGLQLKCLDEAVFASDKNQQEKRNRIAQAKAETPRKIKFVCIKNRYGISNYSCAFDYYPQYDLFVHRYACTNRKESRAKNHHKFIIFKHIIPFI